MRRIAVALAIFGATVAATGAAAEEIKTLQTPRGVTQAFVYLRRPGTPTASVILFSGGDGHLKLAGRERMGAGGNFLVRTRGKFAGQGFLVAVPDAPSDRTSWGLTDFRTSAKHADDVGALIAFLRSEAPVPVWLVGTSMGSVSAASVAAKLPPGSIDGIVLTSSVTAWSKSQRESLNDVRLGDIRVPVFVVHHEADTCPASLARDAERIAPKLTASPRTAVRFFKGGDTPRSGPCEPFAPHGYLGIEDSVVASIAAFIRGEQP